ncbi:MAG: aldose 1-epimerase family protein, partial [Ginsengibacter sp.]
AELQSLQYNGLEYLWQALASWPQHSPVLFPFVGQLKDGKYIFENKEYRMPRHGFARDKVFTAIKTSGTTVTFTLTSDENTLAIYPFSFIFKVEYSLEETRLLCTYIVKNADKKIMYFSVGGHPAFNVPLRSNLGYTDYLLKFNNDSVLSRYLIHDGLTGDNTETINLNNDELQLQQSLFYNDAIVLKHLKSNQVELLTLKDKHGLKFSFDGFPYFGIWAAKDAPFVCLEPWSGIADSIFHDYQLVNKEGINQLGSGGSWQKTWNVDVY